jgi:RNA polymerase sigma-70 factor (ECF subfamily)
MALPRPDRSSLPDEELIRLVRSGETDAFAEFVRRTQRPAYRLARRITRNHEDADDVLQESYAKAYRALDRFEAGRAFGPWFFTIVARTALSLLRRGKLRAAESLDDPDPDGIPLAERIADPAASSDSQALLWDVERAYARLSEEHRTILALRVEADLSYAAIAEVLEAPVGTVMSRLARAREALLKELTGPRGSGADETGTDPPHPRRPVRVPRRRAAGRTQDRDRGARDGMSGLSRLHRRDVEARGRASQAPGRG